MPKKQKAYSPPRDLANRVPTKAFMPPVRQWKDAYGRKCARDVEIEEVEGRYSRDNTRKVG